MQFSENWLRTYVNPALSTDELGHAMTMAGLEVEAQDPAGVAFTRVVIGEIVEAAKHPDADRLQVLKVNVGQESLQIVCGAANARVGLKAPCALVGAELPGFNIKQAKVRGVESFGMMCSAKELGLAAEATGLLELPTDAPTGQDIREFLGLNDTLFTLKLTPNRADCLSILGIARDVAAMTGAPINVPKVAAVPAKIADFKTVKLIAKAACPAYFGRVVRGINAQAKTPDWMLQRLERSGIRGISAIVDITNYVLLAMGQPMHAFDLAKLSGDVEVRFAHASESLKLLNDTEVKLKPDDLVIADSQGAVALAGVMGGAASAVSDSTTDIFLESAFFVPDVMAGKARRLGLSTDSSYRFERGVDFGNTQNALEYATQLVLEICGGEAGPISQQIADLPARPNVALRHARLLSVLGMPIETAQVQRYLSQLGFTFTFEDECYTVSPPSYRFDITREEDLIEEIARLHGYDHLPAIAPVAAQQMLPAAEYQRGTNAFAEILAGLGYQEAITYSFVDAAWERDLMGNESPIAIKNPIASNMSVMRSGLWGGLLEALQYNLNRKQERAMLFEIGARYSKVGEQYVETQVIAGLVYGAVLPEQWAQPARAADFYDVKAHINVLTQNAADYQAATHLALHPGQCAQVVLGGKPVGLLGKLHPKLQQQYGLTQSTFLFEIELAPISKTKPRQYQEVAKFLPVRRDLAVLVDEKIAVGDILNALQMAKIPLLQQAQLFDVYQGKGVPEGKKSLAFLILMQDTSKNLLDEELETVVQHVRNLLHTQFSAELRT